ncbi:Dual specificity phosphatase: catalytic domain containing protein-like protein [Leptotrombidium deliense]|uniref:Dual specificity phosphatase: catalytic domain containing protein-like protein n=1 Tax=Leptotrombidium deliense TaxID=299467 RepID=A0A443S003_9ACAR|nr:Dual specificity phosphatase: catalytic domain containing protein-like protein [Leptotrombidium deliense]
MKDLEWLATNCPLIRVLHLKNVDLRYDNDIDNMFPFNKFKRLRDLYLKNAVFDQYGDTCLSHYISTSSTLSCLRISTKDYIDSTVFETEQRLRFNEKFFGAFIDSPSNEEPYLATMKPYACACEQPDYAKMYKVMWKQGAMITLQKFRQVYTKIMNDHVCPKVTAQAHEIIPNLFLGGIHALNVHEYDYIIDISTYQLDERVIDKDKTLVIIARDDSQTQLSQYFEDTGLFIHNALKHNKSILVHCFAGISRSVSIVVAYLIKYQQLSFIDALQFVKSKRNCAKPNSSFMLQLAKYDHINR